MEVMAELYTSSWITTCDITESWGKIYCIADSDINNFLIKYFPNIILGPEFTLSGRILVINSNSQTPFTYNHAQKTIWNVLCGPVGYVCSYDDIEPSKEFAQTNYEMIIDKEERHKLIGLDNIAVVAEIQCKIISV